MVDSSCQSAVGSEECRTALIVASSFGGLLGILALVVLVYYCIKMIRRSLGWSVVQYTSHYPFIMYHKDTEDWINERLIPHIADFMDKSNSFNPTVIPHTGLKCMLSRVSYPSPIEPNILETRVVIIMLTDGFVASEWRSNPVQVQRLNNFIRSRRNMTILVNMTDSDTDHMGETLKSLVQSKTRCIRWPNPAEKGAGGNDPEEVFWKQFRSTVCSLCRLTAPPVTSKWEESEDTVNEVGETSSLLA